MVLSGTQPLPSSQAALPGAARYDEIPPDYAGWRQHDLEGRLVTPALIDCHTHIVFGGNRAREFEMRLAGRNL